MTGNQFSLGVCLAWIAVLTACGSAPAANNSNAGGAETGSVGTGTNQPNGSTPDPANVITLENGRDSMRVLWTVSGYVFRKQAAEAMLFKPLDINDNSITLDNQTCQGVTFRKETVKSAEYLASTWQTTPQELGIDDQELRVFKTDCGLPGFQEYMQLADGRLIVPINGVFFFFEPKVSR